MKERGGWIEGEDPALAPPYLEVGGGSARGRLILFGLHYLVTDLLVILQVQDLGPALRSGTITKTPKI